MQEHQKRVVEEKSDLDGKLNRLQAFIQTPNFTGLGEDERDRLRRQADVMADYSVILGERIAAF